MLRFSTARIVPFGFRVLSHSHPKSIRSIQPAPSEELPKNALTLKTGKTPAVRWAACDKLCGYIQTCSHKRAAPTRKLKTHKHRHTGPPHPPSTTLDQRRRYRKREKTILSQVRCKCGPPVTARAQISNLITWKMFAGCATVPSTRTFRLHFM